LARQNNKTTVLLYFATESDKTVTFLGWTSVKIVKKAKNLLGTVFAKGRAQTIRSTL
jgi:hypothetical protein